MSTNDADLLWNLVDNAPFAMVLTRDDDVLYFNTFAKAMLGYDIEDIPTMTTAFEKFYPDPRYRAIVMDKWMNEQMGGSPSPELVPTLTPKRTRSINIS